MKKSLKVLLYSLVAILLFFFLLVSIVWLQRNSIKQYAVKQLNEQLSAPVSVSSIDITFTDQFPRVSLLLNNVVITDPIRPKRNLLNVKRLFIAFNLYDILTQQYNIKLIEADSGYCHLFVDDKGRSNFNILKTSPSGQKDIFVSLNRIILRDIELVYEQPDAQQLYDIRTQEVFLSGNFSGKKESLNAQGILTVNKIQSGVQLLKHKPVAIDIALHIDESQSLFSIQKGAVHIGTLALECAGSITSTSPNTKIDLSFKASKLAITDLLELLPGSLNAPFKEYKSEGKIYFEGTVKGNISAKQQPLMQVKFGIENGTLTAPKQHIAIQHIYCTGELSNGEQRNLMSSFVELPSLQFEIGSGKMEGSLALKNFHNPSIKLALKGYSSLNDLLRFTQSNWIERANGKLDFDISVNSNLRQLQSKQGLLSSETNGHISVDASDIVFAKGQKSIERLQTELSLTGKDLSINQFKASIDQSDVVVSGTLQNIIPYLLSENQTLTADLTYKSDYINLEHLILPVPAANNSQTNFVLPEFISVKADIGISQLVFHQFQANQLKGTLIWKGKKIETPLLQAETMKGKIGLKGSIENTADGNFRVVSAIDCKQTDIYELFRQCGNFGQNAITDKHVRGNLTATVDVAGEWNNKMECNMDKLLATCDIHITNGQLLNYEPLEALSKYVSVDDLRNLKFADLQNKIEISRKTIRIPSMNVLNNALNINISGTHTFDNFMDYHLRIKLSELISKKRKKTANEFNEEETADGIFIYLSMKGPADNLKFSYDKKEAREQLKENLKKESEAAKNIWKKELGIDKDGSIKEKKTDSDELEFEQE